MLCGLSINPNHSKFSLKSSYNFLILLICFLLVNVTVDDYYKTIIANENWYKVIEESFKDKFEIDKRFSIKKDTKFDKEKLKELEARREKYANESDFASVEMITRQIDEMEDDILDSCDATLKIEATRIYQYENNVIIDCANGQTIIMDSDVVKSLKTSSIEYEKRDGKVDEKYRVHYNTFSC